MDGNMHGPAAAFAVLNSRVLDQYEHASEHPKARTVQVLVETKYASVHPSKIREDATV